MAMQDRNSMTSNRAAVQHPSSNRRIHPASSVSPTTSSISRLEHIQITRIENVKLFDRSQQHELVPALYASHASHRGSNSGTNDAVIFPAALLNSTITASLRKGISALNDIYSGGGGNNKNSANKTRTSANSASSSAVGRTAVACDKCKFLTLCITESHLILIPQHNSFPGELWLSHSLILHCERLPARMFSTSNIETSQQLVGYPLHIRCKHFVSFTLVIDREDDACKLHSTLLRLANPCRLQELPCFTRATTLHLREEATENTKSLPFDILSEWSRQTLPSRQWRISDANRQYSLSETYPELLVLPTDASVTLIRGSAKFRSKNRLPALTYFHQHSYGAIVRCSQPLSGFNMRSSDDEKLFELIKNSCPQSQADQVLWLVDVRPKLNAIVNRAQGKGYELEANYSGMRSVFFAVENIHVMRSSYEKLYDLLDANIIESQQAACASSVGGGSGGGGASSVPIRNFYEKLDSSSWLRHIQLLLKAACFVAKKCIAGYSVVVHCSDGWDRTAQVCSLAQIIMDPYYRTLSGFQALIAKDWLAFGHKFTDRCGHLQGPLDTSSDDAEAIISTTSTNNSNSINSIAAAKQQPTAAAAAFAAAAPLMTFAALNSNNNDEEFKTSAAAAVAVDPTVSASYNKSAAAKISMPSNNNNSNNNMTNSITLSYDSGSSESAALKRSGSTGTTGGGDDGDEYDKCELLLSSVEAATTPVAVAAGGGSDNFEFLDPLRSSAATATTTTTAMTAAEAEIQESKVESSSSGAGAGAATNGSSEKAVKISNAPSRSNDTIPTPASITTASTISNHEQSPVFTQFLDCVYQMQLQHAQEFEFDERLLLALQQAAYSAEYETFVGNSEKQRVELNIESTSPTTSSNSNDHYLKSFWHHVQNNTSSMYTNKFYQKSADKNDFNELAIDTDMQRLELWYNLYARCDDWLMQPPTTTPNNFSDSSGADGAVAGAATTAAVVEPQQQNCRGAFERGIMKITQQVNVLENYVQQVAESTKQKQQQQQR